MAPVGVGLGLRWEFAEHFADDQPRPALPFLEVAPENYVGRSGRYGALLDHVGAQYPLLSHGLSLSVGGHEPFDPVFLRALRVFLERIGAAHHSDHLCFGWVDGVNLHDLLPVVRTEAEVLRIADRIRHVLDALGRPFAVENVSAYLEPEGTTMPEPEFLAALCDAADCRLLLDVNNLEVNAQNFGFDPFDWLARAPVERTVHVHVAGPDWFELEGGSGMWVDTHGSQPKARTLDLLAAALRRTGPVPVVLEWDTAIPAFAELLAEVERVRAVYDEALR